MGESELHARKWLSNSAKVLEKISAEDCSDEVNLSKISTTSENTWVTLDCKKRSVHLGQCTNWDRLSVLKAKFAKKDIVTL